MNHTSLTINALDQSKDAFWIVNLDFQLIYANKTYLNTIKKITGSTQELYKPVFLQNDAEKWKSYYKRAFNGEYFEVENHFYDPNLQENKPRQTTFEPLTNDHDEIFAVTCRWKNKTPIINQETQANQLLNYNKTQDKETQKLAQLGTWYYDVINNVSHWSDETYNIWGLNPKTTSIDLIDYQKIVHPKDWERFNAVIDDATKKGIPYKMEIELIMPDGSSKIINTVGSPVFDKNNKMIAFRGSTQDISDLKIILNELKDAKEQLQKTQNAINEVSRLAKTGYWSYNNTLQALTWSDYLYQLYNLTPEDEILSYEEAFNYFDAPSQEKITEASKDLYKDGTPYDLELRIVNSKNEEIWIRNIVQPVYNKLKKIVGKRGIIQNITEEKNLRELNKEVAKMVKIGSWSVDLEKNTAFWSEQVHELHETDSKSYVPNLEEAINFYREDFRQLVQSEVENTIKTGKPWDFEAVIVTTKKKEIWIRAIGNAEYINGKCVRIYGGFQDINTRKQAENRLQSLTNNLPGVAYQYIIYPDGTDALRSVSTGSKKVWGFSPEEVTKDIQLVWNNIRLGGDIDKVLKSMSDSIASKSKWSSRFKYVMPNGELKVHLGKGTPTYLADGTILFNSIILDVSQEAKNEELLMQTTQIAKVGSWEMSLINQEGDNMYWSPMIRKILEIDDSYNPTLISGIKFHVGQSKDIIKQALNLLIKNGTEFNEEVLLRTAKGNERWCRAIGKREVVNNIPTRIYGSYQDIHERKTATLAQEKSLKELQDYKYSLDQSAIITFTNQKGEIIYANDNFYKTSGYKKEELIGKNHRIVNSNHHSKAFFNNLWRTIASGKVWRGEVKNKAKDGSYYWVDTTITPFLNEENKPTKYLSIRFDITERKKAEDDKARFLKTLENSLNEIYMFDSETFKFIYVNKGAKQNLGYTKKELNTLTPLDLKPDHTASSFNQLVSPLKNHKKKEVVFFSNHKRKDGSLYPVEVHLKLVEEEDYKSFIAIVLDITERKKAEEDLIASSERLRLATTTANIGIWEWDVLSNKLIWDKTMFKVFGIAENEFNGTFETWASTVHPDDIDKANEEVQNALQGLSKLNMEFRVIWPDKSIRHVQGDAIVINDPVSGEPIKMIGTNIDITERKNAEQEILETKEQIEVSEAKFKSYTEKSPVAIYTTDVNGDCNYANKTWLDITGMTNKEAFGKGWLNALHPEDIEQVNSNWYKSVKTKGKWRFEYRFLNKKNKEITWVEGTAKKMFNEKNEFIGYLGTNVNITERIKAEETYRLLADNSNDIITLQNTNNQLKYTSPSVENILGYKQEELADTDFLELIHKDDVKKIDKTINKNVLEDENSNTIEYRIRHKKGHYVWLEESVSPIFKKGQVVSFVTTNRDISRWVLAKKEIQDYQSSLQKLTTELSLTEEKQKKRNSCQYSRSFKSISSYF